MLQTSYVALPLAEVEVEVVLSISFRDGLLSARFCRL